MIQFSQLERIVRKSPKKLIFSHIQLGIDPIKSNGNSSRSLFSNIPMLVTSITWRALSNGIFRFSITKIRLFTFSIGPSLIPKILFRLWQNLTIPLDRAQTVLVGKKWNIWKAACGRIAYRITRMVCKLLLRKYKGSEVRGALVLIIEYHTISLDRAQLVVVGLRMEPYK